MSDSVRPHRWQPTRLRPWDSPGKNTGVGCHFLLQCMKVKSESEVTQTLSNPMDCSLLGSSAHGIFQARLLEWGAIAFSRWTWVWVISSSWWWTGRPGVLRFMESRRVGHDWATSLSLFTFMHWRRKWQPTPVFLPWESQGRGSLVGCHLWGCTESDTTEAT